MSSPIYEEATEDDFRLSGPIVWPRLIAEKACDRFIFRRPELAYLVSLRRIERQRIAAGHPQPIKNILIRVILVRHVDKRRVAEQSRDFWHTIDRDEPISDVRAFLSRLREVLFRLMPEDADPKLACQIRFLASTDVKKIVLSFQDKWV